MEMFTKILSKGFDVLGQRINRSIGVSVQHDPHAEEFDGRETPGFGFGGAKGMCERIGIGYEEFVVLGEDLSDFGTEGGCKDSLRVWILDKLSQEGLRCLKFEVLVFLHVTMHEEYQRRDKLIILRPFRAHETRNTLIRLPYIVDERRN
jgi:hypothetical protein